MMMTAKMATNQDNITTMMMMMTMTVMKMAMMVIMMAHHLSSGLPTKITSLPSFVFTVLLCHLSSN